MTSVVTEDTGALSSARMPTIEQEIEAAATRFIDQNVTDRKQPAKFDQPSHTHHAAGTPGAACTACRMPTTTYMEVDPQHDHSIRIPRPDLSVTLGVPNACNNCHVKKTAQWASATLIAALSDSPT